MLDNRHNLECLFLKCNDQWISLPLHVSEGHNGKNCLFVFFVLIVTFAKKILCRWDDLCPPLTCSYVNMICLFDFRFEAHMEVHAGSIDEEDDEQGIAHMIEHVAFLGSKKREKLLGTGARSNAYTDFHHTVFHIHSPTSTKVFFFFFPIALLN